MMQHRLLLLSLLLLVTAGIHAELRFSPSKLEKEFHIPLKGHLRSDDVELRDSRYNTFSWKIKQKNYDCNPISLSPTSGEYTSSQRISISYDESALRRTGSFECQIVIGNRTVNALAELWIKYKVISDYCYDQTNPDFYCQKETPHTHCDLTSGNCVCDKNYYGQSCTRYCNTTTCAHGTCNTGSGTYEPLCNCQSNYYGTKCDVFCNAALNCSSSNAHCNPKGACVCDDNYYGKDCEIYCSPAVTCKYGGICTDQGECKCDTGRYGKHCEYIECPTCIHGTCNNQTGTCECEKNYYGDNCANFCNQTLCGYHGKCNFTGECSCDLYWHGKYCAKYCNVFECGSRAFCNATFDCQCRENYYGDNCYVFCAQNMNCFHGICNSTGGCECNENYFGEQCERYCVAEDTCSGRGKCDNKTGACICDDEYMGPGCGVTKTTFWLAFSGVACGITIIAVVIIIVIRRKRAKKLVFEVIN